MLHLETIASITVGDITNIPCNESFVFGGSLTGGYPLFQADPMICLKKAFLKPIILRPT